MSLDPPLYSRLSRYLPADMLAALPDPQALAAAIRRLSSLQQAVSSFLPQYIADNERLYTEDYGDLRPGTFLFADVSGFTALSEKLQKASGNVGTEVLTGVINQFFARMLEILAKSNGQLLKFAGDALLMFFPAASNADEAPFAIRTGLRMQREMATDFQPIKNDDLIEWFGADHGIELTMSIGVCRGQLFESVVGNTTQRDHIIQGSLPGRAMEAEAAGERDDVIITADLRDAYAAEFDTEPVSDDFYRVIDNFGDQLSDYEFVVPLRRRATTALFDFFEENLLEELERHLERVDGVARFVAREVVNRLAAQAGQSETDLVAHSDNRPATVIFTHMSGVADMLSAWGEEQLPLLVSILNRYYNLMQRTIAANGGSLTRTDPYQHGIKLLITFGAPVAHEDDPIRAVMTALEMNRQLADLNERLREELPEALRLDTFLCQRIGITQGMVFAGQVGWQSRREYTVMGDDVNLAARLMGKGEMGRILISQRVWDVVSPHFETEALPPFMLKGKTAPTQAYLVKASTVSALSRSATSDTPFVGRDMQLLTMTMALQQARGPRRRQAFALRGEAGVGKTRMAKQIAQAAEDTGFRVAWANCQLSHSQDQSVWSALLFQLLQLDQAKSEEAQRRLLNVRLAEMDLAELESVFELLLFGSIGERAAPPALPQTPDQPVTAGAPPPPRKTVPSIFERAEPEVDLAKSGIFGMARDQLKAALEAAQETPTRPFWQTVQRQTSLPDCVTRFIQVFADRNPTLLIIDDLHRADATTLAMLKQVVAEIAKSRLMVLVTCEPPEDDPDLGIQRKVTVSDLEEDETAQLAARVLNAHEVGPRLRALIWERTKGRPLFVESLLHLLDQDGHIKKTGARAELAGDMSIDTLPDNVRQLLTSQIDRLSADARALLQVASVLGDGFTAEMLIALSEGAASEIRLETLLGEMIFEEIIEPLPDMTYRFRHGLAQATVYESLSRLQRQRLHRDAADFLADHGDPDRVALKVAYHLVKGGLPLRGIELVSQAADRAEQNQQLDRAIELYTHARDIFPHDESVRAQLERLQALRA